MSKYEVTSGPYFPAFGLNTDIYSVNLSIQSKYRKMRTRNNSAFGHFSGSDKNQACLSVYNIFHLNNILHISCLSAFKQRRSFSSIFIPYRCNISSRLHDQEWICGSLISPSRATRISKYVIWDQNHKILLPKVVTRLYENAYKESDWRAWSNCLFSLASSTFYCWFLFWYTLKRSKTLIW